MNYAICGIDCDTCKFKTERDCPGCRANEGQPFWGTCDLYACCHAKHLRHCGQCDAFPCDTLKQWAESENPERIDNLRNLPE